MSDVTNQMVKAALSIFLTRKFDPMRLAHLPADDRVLVAEMTLNVTPFPDCPKPYA